MRRFAAANNRFPNNRQVDGDDEVTSIGSKKKYGTVWRDVQLSRRGKKMSRFPQILLVTLVAAALASISRKTQQTLVETIKDKQAVLLEENRSVDLSPREQFVALSDMLPEYRGGCPDLPEFPAEVLTIADVVACGNLIKQAASQNNCIIYNFGVGTTDPFLNTMGSSSSYRNCTVYAFDPFVSITEVPEFGPNVHFYPVGLWNGHTNRSVGTKGGTLMSLFEIQTMLNHTRDMNITFFRSDCEGCEYGWVKHAMDDDRKIFERISQMFIEIHMVPVHGMPALSLPWSSDGEPPAELLEPLYDMMTKYFRVLAAQSNPGYPADRNRVPMVLQQHGVIPYPCCREFHLISTSLVGPLQQQVDNQSCETDEKAFGLEQVSESFAALFHGQRNTCPDGQPPVTFHNDAFCPNILEKQETPFIYFFGNFSVDTEFLQYLSTKYPNAVIYAFDPTWSERFWLNQIVKASAQLVGGNVRFFPWGLYSGHGARILQSVTTTTTTTTTSNTTGLDVIGELYTLEEIARSWTPKDFHPREITSLPRQIDLLRVDGSRTASCVWEREISKPFKTWWGEYLGLESVKQASFGMVQ